MEEPVQKVSIDFETRSRRNLRKCGAYKYAECPSAKVLVLAIKKGGWNDPSPYLKWDIRKPHNEAVALLREAIEKGWEIHAYNSQFEWAILKHVCPRQFGFPIPDINKMRCTAALCRSAGLPPTLAQCAKFLNLEVQKDTVGKPLVNRFCVPVKKTGEFLDPGSDETFTLLGKKVTANEAFDLFVDYCVTDVKSEVLVAETMAPFALRGFALDCFLADARLNDRGVPVNVKALRHAFRLYREHEANLKEKFKALTGLAPAQPAVLEWLKAEGYPGNNLKKETREAYADDPGLSEKGREALAIRGELSFAAVKKIPAMLEWVMNDGFIRGSFMWCGAQKTWRWSSKGVQWQNMKKPKKSLRQFIEEAFQFVELGIDLGTFSDFYGDPYEVIASLARYFVRFEDAMIYDLDYSSVEAKILPMLIGCRRILERFGTGEDLYTTTAVALTTTLREKFPDFPYDIDRDQGKTIVLATQFQGGWNAVFTATGKKWKREWCEVAVSVVRKQTPEFGQAWKKFQDAFVEAMDNPAVWVEASPYVKLGYTAAKPFPRMMIRLPSGRKITLPLPRKNPITMVKVEKYDPKTDKKINHEWQRVTGHFSDQSLLESKLSIGHPFLNPDTRIKSFFATWEISYYGHVKGKHYGRVNTYGGDTLQSATQATGVDLLALGVLEAERHGFQPFFLVHDQCLAPARGDRETFVNALCRVPKWFKGFPLEAEADVVRSYCKN